MRKKIGEFTYTNGCESRLVSVFDDNAYQIEHYYDNEYSRFKVDGSSVFIQHDIDNVVDSAHFTRGWNFVCTFDDAQEHFFFRPLLELLARNEIEKTILNPE